MRRAQVAFTLILFAAAAIGAIVVTPVEPEPFANPEPVMQPPDTACEECVDACIEAAIRDRRCPNIWQCQEDCEQNECREVCEGPWQVDD